MMGYGSTLSDRNAALLGCLLFIILRGATLCAFDYTYDENASFRYNDALQLYRQGEFGAAAEQFSALIEDYPWDARISIFQMLYAKALLYDRQYVASRSAFERLMKAHANSTYLPSCRYFLGKIHYALGQYDSALQAFFMAADQADNIFHQRIFRDNFIATALGNIPPERIISYQDQAADEGFAFEIGLTAAERYYLQRDFGSARRMAGELALKYPAHADDKQLAALLGKIEQFQSKKAVIALFAPLSGDLSRFGRMMLNAMELALENYDGSPGINVEPKTFDTFGNMIASAIDAKRLANQPVSAIIGPLSSAEAVGVAAFAEIGGIPVIAPTASEKGLTSISDMFFQLAPTPERMGAALAEFACNEFGLDSVAILAPLDNYGKQITDGFVQVAQEKGVTIFYQKFYPRGLSDFRRFLLDLKKELLPKSFVEEIFLNAEGDTLEAEEIPLRVPALFMPSYTSELQLLLPQIRFYKISTLLLGTDSYGEAEIVKMQESFDNPIIFVSKTLTLAEDTSWLKFNYLYQTKYQEVPEQVAAATYDAFNLVLDCVRQGLYTSEDIWRCVLDKKIYGGASGKIRFSAQRENIFVPVYFLNEGEIIRLE